METYYTINNYNDPNLDILKIATNTKQVLKGYREVIKGIQKKNVNTIFIAKNETLGGKYRDSIIELANQSGSSVKKIFMVSDFVILRDIVINGSISTINELRQKKPKGPKCYVAAIKN